MGVQSAASEVIGEATISVANGYKEVLLQQNLQSNTVSLVVASRFFAYHKQQAQDTFSSLCSCLYNILLISVTVCTSVNVCSNSSDTLNADNLGVLIIADIGKNKYFSCVR